MAAYCQWEIFLLKYSVKVDALLYEQLWIVNEYFLSMNKFFKWTPDKDKQEKKRSRVDSPPDNMNMYGQQECSGETQTGSV